MSSIAIPFEVYRILVENREKRYAQLQAKALEIRPDMPPEFAAWFHDLTVEFTEIFEAFMREGSIESVRGRLREACRAAAEAGLKIESVFRILHEASVRGREDLIEALPGHAAMLPKIFVWLDEYNQAVFDEFCQAQAAARERAESALARSHAQMDAVFNSAPLGLIFVDADRVIQRVNDEACTMLGYPPPSEIERADMRGFRDKIKGNYKDPEGFMRLLDEVYADPENKRWGTLETIMPARRTIAFNVRPVHDGAGAPIGWIWIFRDITERVAAEKLRKDLVHMLVHDLKNPLTVIRGAATMLRSVAGQAGPAAGQTLDLLERSSDRMLGMVMNMLDIERLEGGKLELCLEDIAPAPFFQAALDGQRPAAGSRQLLLELAPGMAASRLRADPNILDRVLANLIGNAIKHTRPDGRIILRAGFVHAPEGPAAAISVIDDGAGIPKEYHEKIFEKFGQAELRREGAKTDTGLGLTFCKLAIEAHGGTIGVKSEPGKGSEFCFHAPVAR